MTVQEAEKLFEVIEAYIRLEGAKTSVDGGLGESIALSEAKQEFLDLIVEGQK